MAHGAAGPISVAFQGKRSAPRRLVRTRAPAAQFAEAGKLPPMPARLPPGLYERLVSLALDRQIGRLEAPFEAQIEAPAATERPRLLARYVPRPAVPGPRGSDRQGSGIGGKREGLEAHDVLLLNRDLVRQGLGHGAKTQYGRAQTLSWKPPFPSGPLRLVIGPASQGVSSWSRNTPEGRCGTFGRTTWNLATDVADDDADEEDDGHDE
jgi:hypothetical protein